MCMTKKIGLSIASLGLAVLLVEAVLRVAIPAPRFHREPLEIDSDFGFRGVRSHHYEWTNPEDDRQTHEIVLNSEGFRGRELAAAAESSETNAPSPAQAPERIVFLGDSFLVGEAVRRDALLTSLVEARWPVAGRSVEVYNLSTIDYGTGQQLLLLNRFGEDIRPQRVILMMYPTNDVANNAIELAGRTRVSPGDAIRPYVMQDSVGAWRREWWMPARARARRLSRLFAWAERGVFARTWNPSAHLGPVLRLRQGDPPREFLEVFREHAEPGNRWTVAWQRTEALIREIRDQSDALNAEFVVGVIPSAYQIVRTPQRIRFEIESRISGKTLSEMIDWNYPERRLERFFREEGIKSVSLLDPFRNQASAGQRLYGRDLHFTQAGHALAAELMLALLEPRQPKSEGFTKAATNGLSDAQPASWAGLTSASWLDLGKNAFAGHFGDGWLSWQAEDGARPGGWLLASEAFVVLRPAGDTLTVKGVVSGPTTLEIGLLGSPLRKIVVRGRGPFEAQAHLDGNPVVAPGGEAAIVIKKQDSATQLLLQEIGFSKAPRSR